METNPTPRQRLVDPDNVDDAHFILGHKEQFPIIVVALARARLLDPWGR